MAVNHEMKPGRLLVLACEANEALRRAHERLEEIADSSLVAHGQHHLWRAATDANLNVSAARRDLACVRGIIEARIDQLAEQQAESAKGAGS